MNTYTNKTMTGK